MVLRRTILGLFIIQLSRTPGQRGPKVHRIRLGPDGFGGGCHKSSPRSLTCSLKDLFMPKHAALLVAKTLCQLCHLQFVAEWMDRAPLTFLPTPNPHLGTRAAPVGSWTDDSEAPVRPTKQPSKLDGRADPYEIQKKGI